jgi:protein-L-isoaspartate(D-aspartate) O-methyltransferase
MKRGVPVWNRSSSYSCHNDRVALGRIRLAALLGAALAACVAAAPPVQSDAEWNTRRFRMVETQIRLRGVKDERVLRAMLKVPRHLFMPEARRAEAYEDHPVPIGLGQTISQPFIVAYMTEALRLAPTDRVLEIGTGSGYQAAILGEIVREVCTMEIIPELAERATTTLESLGYRNVRVRTGNGYLGWPEAAPFDKIIVTAAPDDVPKALVDQLGENGTMIVPVGVLDQMMTIIRKTPLGVVQRETIPVLFVPMTGKPKK